jgi:hypothetical protein
MWTPGAEELQRNLPSICLRNLKGNLKNRNRTRRRAGYYLNEEMEMHGLNIVRNAE